MASQTVFEHCYRGRQSDLHHMAYLRMGKVLLLRRLTAQTGISLEGKAIFDYGFGAGTFFRYCPPTASLFGVEMDPENVEAVTAMLTQRGHRHLDLQTIEIVHWESHPLLAREYDVIVCSHVLEHLDEPVTLLRRFHGCLRPGGVILALVPINEWVDNPHHIQKVNRPVVDAWAEASGLRLGEYVEEDPWFYWGQSLFTADQGWRHALAQACSLGVGVVATGIGPRGWGTISQGFAALTRSRPTQAGFVLRR